jgi:hypothetical protein
VASGDIAAGGPPGGLRQAQRDSGRDCLLSSGGGQLVSLPAQALPRCWPPQSPASIRAPAGPGGSPGGTGIKEILLHLSGDAMRASRSSRATLPMIAGITVAMVCGVLAGVGVHWAAALRHDRLSQVSATILEPAAWDGSRPATGRWPAPDGTSRAGTIPAPPGRPAGTQVPVWVGQTGQITAAPEAPFYRVAHPLLAGAAVAGGIILLPGTCCATPTRSILNGVRCMTPGDATTCNPAGGSVPGQPDVPVVNARPLRAAGRW